MHDTFKPRDAPLHIGGGGWSFCWLQFYLPLQECFLCWITDTTFVLLNNGNIIFCVCLPFSGQHICYQFCQRTCVCSHFQQAFYSTFVATNVFFIFLPGPLPQISCASLTAFNSCKIDAQSSCTNIFECQRAAANMFISLFVYYFMFIA